MQQLVISTLGKDHPGIVNRFTETMAEYQVNIGDSRMVSLCGQFAMIMLVQVSEDKLDEFRHDLPGICDEMGLSVTVGVGGKEVEVEGDGIPYRIRTYAMDQLGLVHRISHVLHGYGANIVQLDTHLGHGPHTGTPLFSMDMVVIIPSDVRLKTVREKLEGLSEELNCDLDIDRA